MLFSIGDLVEGNFKELNNWYQCRIIKVHGSQYTHIIPTDATDPTDSTDATYHYDLKYIEDGVIELNVHSHRIRPLATKQQTTNLTETTAIITGERVVYTSKTTYKGVCENGNRGYKAQITSAGKVKNLGSFSNCQEAAIAYDRQAIVENKKEFNFPDMVHLKKDLPATLKEQFRKSIKRKSGYSDSSSSSSNNAADESLDGSEFRETKRQRSARLTALKTALKVEVKEASLLKMKLLQAETKDANGKKTFASSSSSDQGRLDVEELYNTTICDSCSFPIINIRYESTNQQDYDLCTACWSKCSIPDQKKYIRKKDAPIGLDKKFRPGANFQKNSKSSKRKYKNKSGYKGVTRMNNKKTKLYRADIYGNNQTYVVGTNYRSKRQAAIAYDAAAVRQGRPNSDLNFPNGTIGSEIDSDEDEESSQNFYTIKKSRDNRNIPVINTMIENYYGVSKYHNNKFMASLLTNEKRIYLGLFSSIEKAAKAYDEFVILMKIDAVLNSKK